MISVDIVACYPASFLGYGFAAEYFKRFGHPTHEMTRDAINGPLPDFELDGFARVNWLKDFIRAVMFELIDIYLKSIGYPQWYYGI